jgi:hypothetical protein
VKRTLLIFYAIPPYLILLAYNPNKINFILNDMNEKIRQSYVLFLFIKCF